MFIFGEAQTYTQNCSRCGFARCCFVELIKYEFITLPRSFQLNINKTHINGIITSDICMSVHHYLFNKT